MTTLSYVSIDNAYFRGASLIVTWQIHKEGEDSDFGTLRLYQEPDGKFFIEDEFLPEHIVRKILSALGEYIFKNGVVESTIEASYEDFD